jgi:ketosteroid isomerase-like protein
MRARFLLCLMLMLPAATSRAGESGAGDAPLEQRQQAFFGAMAARDLSATLRLFAADAVVHVAGMPPVAGRDAVGRFYARMFEFLGASDATAEAWTVAGSGDLAFSHGRTTNRFEGPEGVQEHTGKFLLVWVREGDEWRVGAYSVSSDQRDGGR